MLESCQNLPVNWAIPFDTSEYSGIIGAANGRDSFSDWMALLSSKNKTEPYPPRKPWNLLSTWGLSTSDVASLTTGRMALINRFLNFSPRTICDTLVENPSWASLEPDHVLLLSRTRHSMEKDNREVLVGQWIRSRNQSRVKQYRWLHRCCVCSWLHP